MSDDIVEPTPQRGAHGLVERLGTTVKDANGLIGRPWRAIDTLTAMLSRRSITGTMFQAGSHFHDLFRTAGLDPLFSADPTRIPVLAGDKTRVYLRNIGNDGARYAVLSALDALGGVNSINGSCAWHVLGCELPLKAWALRRGRLDKMVATGILIADLTILEQHYCLKTR